jgi:basic amino acid/polyamine antiporter, APA family
VEKYFFTNTYVCCDKQVCCLAAEAKDPNRVLPLAVFGTITIVTVFYCLASLALVGMQDYRLINVDSGFSEALKSRGCIWSQNFVAVGRFCLLCPSI